MTSEVYVCLYDRSFMSLVKRAPSLLNFCDAMPRRRLWRFFSRAKIHLICWLWFYVVCLLILVVINFLEWISLDDMYISSILYRKSAAHFRCVYCTYNYLGAQNALYVKCYANKKNIAWNFCFYSLKYRQLIKVLTDGFLAGLIWWTHMDYDKMWKS